MGILLEMPHLPPIFSEQKLHEFSIEDIKGGSDIGMRLPLEGNAAYIPLFYKRIVLWPFHSG
jgi:hypothetical protein